jgi:hypothetical protein
MNLSHGNFVSLFFRKIIMMKVIASLRRCIAVMHFEMQNKFYKLWDAIELC